MAYRKEVTTSQSAPEQRRVVETSAASGAARIIYVLVGIVEGLLAIRFIFKLAGANPGSSFVMFIYSITDVLTAPFRGIFRTAATEGVETTSVFEPATLIAMAIYALIGWAIIRFVGAGSRE